MRLPEPEPMLGAGRSYWLVAGAFLILGGIGIFSFVGFTVFFMGVVLCVLGPLRSRPRVFWPTLAGMVSFIAAVIIFTPLGCTTTRTTTPTSASVAETCSYAMPVVLSLLIAIATAMLTRRLLPNDR